MPQYTTREASAQEEKEVFQKMTVKEAASVLTQAKKLYISWCENITPFDKDDELMMDAYGSYKVKRIYSGTERETYEIHIAALPMKEVSA